MPNPTRERWEKFCQLVTSGETHVHSYVKAGFSGKGKPATLNRHTKRLMKKPWIRKRLANLQKKTETNMVMGVIERKERLSEIARAKLPDFVKLDNDGNMTIDINAANNAALSEVQVEEWKNQLKGITQSRASRVKLINPVTAIAELNKMDGVYKPEGGDTFNIINIDKALITAGEKLESKLTSLATRLSEKRLSGQSQ